MSERGAMAASGAGVRSDRSAMTYRQLGSTSLHVSVLGFGASPFGDVYGTTSPAEDAATVGTAIECGINFFDVSPYYGLTKAERRLGEALRGRRQEVVLATKCGRYGTDEFNFSAERITGGLEDSLTRLHTDYVDLLQAHDVEFGRVDQIVEETVPAMRRLQEQGKTRYVGITGYSLKNLMAIARRVKVDSILSYCRYDLMVRDLEDELLPFAQEAGIGVINASPLHMGILTERGAPEWHPAPPAVMEAGRAMVRLAKEKGVDLQGLALQFACSQGGVASTLAGMATSVQVRANCEALSRPMDFEMVRAMKGTAGDAFDTVWPSGLEENWG